MVNLGQFDCYAILISPFTNNTPTHGILYSGQRQIDASNNHTNASAAHADPQPKHWHPCG
jgi:hypothetical protein